MFSFRLRNWLFEIKEWEIGEKRTRGKSQDGIDRNGEWKRQNHGLNRSDQVDKGALNRVSEDGNACVLVDGVSDILTNECMHFHAIVALNPTARAHNTKPDYHCLIHLLLHSVKHQVLSFPSCFLLFIFQIYILANKDQTCN